MKKKSNQTRAGGRILVPKWMMKMKVVFILLVCSLVQVQAAVSARQLKVSIELKNVTLEKVFQELERQTGYSFLYNHREVVTWKNVSISAENQGLEAVLKDLLPRLGMSFSFDDNLGLTEEKKPCCSVCREKDICMPRMWTRKSRQRPENVWRSKGLVRIC